MKVIKKNTGKILTVILVSVICVCAITSTILAERAITLARVRQVDFHIIAELLAANQAPNFEGIRIERASRAFNQLKGGADLRDLRVGLLLERKGEVLASNIGDRSVADVTEELSLGPEAVEKRMLGNDTLLTAIFPDRKYSFYVGNSGFGPTPWHWEFSVPFQQFMDGRLAQGVILPKAGTALGLMLFSAFSFVCLWLAWEYHTDRTRRDLEESLQASRIAEKHCQTNARDWKQRAQTAKEEKKEAEDEALEWMLKADKQKRIREKLEQKLEDHSENSLFSYKKDTQKLLDNIWLDLDWHMQAKKEAITLFQTGQPDAKRQLSRLLGQLFKEMRMPEDWASFKDVNVDVWHNGRTQHAKLYCSTINKRLTVMAVDSGKGSHKQFDGGKKLAQRYKTMQK